MSLNNDVFGMLTASPADLPSDKPKKEKSEKHAEETKASASEVKAPVSRKTSKFKYPFQLYMGSRLRDVTGMFDEGREYSGDEITQAMIAADEYFFTGKIEYDYMPETNTVVAMAVQHKKG